MSELRISRILPRFFHGGAERAVLQLLEAFPGTRLGVLEGEGPLFERARGVAGETVRFRPPSFERVLDFVADAEVFVYHVVNDQAWCLLAAQLAGVPAVVQVLHNELSAETTDLADHTLLVDPGNRALLTRPGAATAVPSAVEVPGAVAPWTPWFAGGRAPRLVEVRRPDKPVHCGLEEVVADPSLAERKFRVDLVGPVKRGEDPRVQAAGLVADPGPHLIASDLVFVGHAQDTFGRAPREALAQGRPVVVLPHPVLMHALGDAPGVFVARGTRRSDAARAIRTALEDLEARGPAGCRELAQRMREYVARTASIPAMHAAHARVLRAARDAPSPPRSFGPEDLRAPGAPTGLARVVDALLSRRPADAMAARSGLSGSAAGVAAWVLARYVALTEGERVRLLEAARCALGPRPLVLTDLGLAHLRSGDLRTAGALLDRAIAADPGHLLPWLGRIEASLLTEDTTAARLQLERLVTALPEAAELPAVSGLLSALGVEAHAAPRRPSEVAGTAPAAR